MPGIAKSHKGRLSGKLQSHHKNAKEINMQRRDPVIQKSRVTIENLDKKVGEEKDQSPDNQSKHDAKNSHKPDRGFYTSIFLGAIIKAHYRLSTVSESVYRDIYDLPY